MNALQYALNHPSWISVLACIVTSLAILQGWKFIRVGLKWFRAPFLKFSWENLILIALLSTVIYLGRFQLSDLIQTAKDCLNPIYAGQFDQLGLDHETAIFEQVISERNDAYTASEIKRSIAETAQKMNCPPAWFYNCSLGECGLEAFRTRKDLVALGWTQLTRNGLAGIKINGKQATMQDVLTACKNRDAKMIMSLNDVYLMDRWMAQGSPKITGPVDIYLLLFAPSKVGKPFETVVYEGYSNPNYYMNDGLDGFYLKDGKIKHSNSRKDGKITVGELALRVELIKNQLLKSKLK